MKDIVIKAENITKIFHKTHKKSSFTGFTYGMFSKGRKEIREDIVTAVDNISFEIAKGQTLGIIGNNGAGKSTLLKILTGITKPTSGKVTVNGEISAFLDMGSSLIPELTGKENIFIYGELQGISPANIRKWYSSIVEFSEIGDYIDTPIKYYSSGMIMRLAFSVIVFSDKDIFIFDEAFAVGDIMFRAKCQKFLYDLKKKNKSVILVSHNMHEAANLCDHMILLNKGKIIASGNAVEVIRHYNDIKYKKDGKGKDVIELYELAKIPENKKIKQEVVWNEDLAPEDIGCKILGAQILCDPEKNKNNGGDLSLRVFIKTSSFHGDIGFAVTDFLDYKLFGDYTLHHLEHNNASVSDGEYALTWSIPLNLLNNGIYKVSLFIFNSEQSVSYRLFDILTFEVCHENDKDQNFYLPVRIKLDFSITDK